MAARAATVDAAAGWREGPRRGRVCGAIAGGRRRAVGRGRAAEGRRPRKTGRGRPSGRQRRRAHGAPRGRRHGEPRGGTTRVPPPHNRCAAHEVEGRPRGRRRGWGPWNGRGAAAAAAAAGTAAGDAVADGVAENRPLGRRRGGRAAARPPAGGRRRGRRKGRRRGRRCGHGRGGVGVGGGPRGASSARVASATTSPRRGGMAPRSGRCSSSPAPRQPYLCSPERYCGTSTRPCCTSPRKKNSRDCWRRRWATPPRRRGRWCRDPCSAPSDD